MRLNIYLDNRADKQGLFPVRVSVSFFGRRYITSLGTNLSKEDFAILRSDYLGETRGKRSIQLKELLKKLSDISDAVDWEQHKVQRGEVSSVDVDLSAVVNKVLGRTRISAVDTKKVADYWLEFITDEREKKDLSEGTLRQLKYFRKKLVEFAPDKTIQELATQQSIEDWVSFIVSRGVNNKTANHNVSMYKWFMGWAYRSGYCGNDFERYKFNLKLPTKVESNVIFLTMPEIDMMAAVSLTGRKAISRDIFLFQCFTGLRISDVLKLRHSDIANLTMRLKIQKTGTYIANKLNRRALDIISRYTGEGSDTIFPNLVLHSIQSDIREVGRLAGITQRTTKIEYRHHERIEHTGEKWEFLTTHVGRKSFIVNSLDMDLTPTQVISYTGHSSIQAMEPYISISNKKKDSAMDVWDANTESGGCSVENEIKMLEERLKILKNKL